MGWNLYVIRLKKSILTNRRFMSRNPDYMPGRPCVYVGLSFHAPSERLAQHLSGTRSASIVRRFGKNLVPSECRVIGPMSRQRAQNKEAALAERLRTRGFAVWSN